MSEIGSLGSCTQRQSASSVDGAWKLSPCRVLVVDDTETSRRLLTICLTRAGAEVVEARHGGEALECARRLEFDVILMDMRMPEMDGFEATRQLRESGFHSDIIALTGETVEGSEQECLAAGCSGFMTKPVPLDHLLSTISQCLEARQRAQATSEDSNFAHGSTSVHDVSEPVISSLPTDDQEFVQIVKMFLKRFDAQLNEMRQAIAREDFARIAELGHWLRGTAGTVGFSLLSDPASLLEDCARAGDRSGVECHLAEIEAIRMRIQLAPC